jgi:SAM-dependent methyltransferase
MAEFLRANRHRLSAKALFELFYDEYSGACGMADYFVYRFGQPRHLAALSACSLIRGRPGVTLDLACGAGHLTHFLTYGLAQPRVIGLDREFIRLFIAKHYMAPQAEFVCMAADGTLPFPDRALSSVLCSDAFHYFPRKAVTARELGRVLDEAGVMILTRMANAHHEPHEGYELDPDGYRGLFPGWCTALAGEGELVDGYLAGRKPQLAASRPTSAVEQEKWLTLFASRSTGLLRDHGTFDDVPHAVGRLGVNPIYVEAPTADGGRRLSFEFPSPWYAFEDGRYRQYAVPSALVSRKVAESVARGIRSPEQDRHIASFALVGMPDLYREPAGASRSGAG